LRCSDVRAGAEVDELAVLVEGDLLALGNVGEAAELVALLAADLMISTASSRETSLRRNGWFSSAIFFISASSLARSSAVNLWSRSMS
jgi:hypothetical protein